MSRREELEHEIELAQQQLDNVTENTPPQVVEQIHQALDSASFDLNNLYDDEEIQGFDN